MARTRASEAVRAWTEENSQQELADRLAKRTGRVVYQATVSAWATGKFVPNGLIVAALELEIGVRSPWWLEPPIVSEQLNGDAA